MQIIQRERLPLASSFYATELPLTPRDNDEKKQIELIAWRSLERHRGEDRGIGIRSHKIADNKFRHSRYNRHCESTLFLKLVEVSSTTSEEGPYSADANPDTARNRNTATVVLAINVAIFFPPNPNDPATRNTPQVGSNNTKKNSQSRQGVLMRQCSTVKSSLQCPGPCFAKLLTRKWSDPP